MAVRRCGSNGPLLVHLIHLTPASALLSPSVSRPYNLSLILQLITAARAWGFIVIRTLCGVSAASSLIVTLSSPMCCFAKLPEQHGHSVPNHIKSRYDLSLSFPLFLSASIPLLATVCR